MSPTRDEVQEAVKVIIEKAWIVNDYLENGTVSESKQTKVPIPKPPRTDVNLGQMSKTSNEPEKQAKNPFNVNQGTQSSTFNLEAINWKTGSGSARRDAAPDAPFSYAFVEDMQGQTYPEVKPLWDAVCRYGSIVTDGWEIIQFGDRAKMIAKRKPKEG